VTDSGGLTATDDATVNILYNFSGFFDPVSNPPTVNLVNAGRAVPFTFSLAGDQGLAIVTSATSVEVSCDSQAASEQLDAPAANSGGSGLSYNPATGQYTFVWKTDKRWANQCRQFSLTLNDGTVHVAIFKFTR